MSVNSSASSMNTQLLSSIHSFLPFGLVCFSVEPSSSIFITTTITNILLLVPLCILVLYHGLQRWRQQCSSSTAASHSDCFTYHLITMELINVFGCILCCYGIYKNIFPMLLAWYSLYSFRWYGETFFHTLTCVEHYLAVVHPLAYLSLRKERWIRIRNIVVGCIWLVCFVSTIVTASGITTSILDACLISSSVIIISFCSLSVLCVLIRPGPGEQSRDQKRLKQSNQRAFYTIVIILGALLLRCASNVVWSALSMMNGGINQCAWIIGEVWCNFPSSLVLPLLFLHRAGKLLCCKNNVE